MWNSFDDSEETFFSFADLEGCKKNKKERNCLFDHFIVLKDFISEDKRFVFSNWKVN